MWSTDEHRWSTTISPPATASAVEFVQWWAELDVGQTEPIGDGEVFATSAGLEPAIGNPPVGNLYIYPVATIATPDGFVQVKGPEAAKTIMAITSVTWVPAADGETNLVGGDKIYPEKNSPGHGFSTRARSS